MARGVGQRVLRRHINFGLRKATTSMAATKREEYSNYSGGEHMVISHITYHAAAVDHGRSVSAFQHSDSYESLWPPSIPTYN